MATPRTRESLLRDQESVIRLEDYAYYLGNTVPWKGEIAHRIDGLLRAIERELAPAGTPPVLGLRGSAWTAATQTEWGVPMARWPAVCHAHLRRLYRDGDFLQALEGEADAVRETFARITRDHRHAGTVVLDQSTIDQREFGSWAMAFRRLTSTEGPAGFVDFFRKSVREREGGASRVLAAFRELGS